MAETTEEFIQRIVREAGAIALSYRRRPEVIRVERKETEKDIVTEADQAVEGFLRREISQAYPDHAVTGEEQGDSGDHPYRWIVDPIDGTVSFYHGQYGFSVSVALAWEDEIILGAVYAPALDDLYFAAKGKGAFLNGRQIRVSSEQRLADAVLSTGFCCYRDEIETDCMELFSRMIPRLRDFRRGGSAALDLCSVASGRLEGYWERCLHLYDIAAGLIILREAGGRVSDYQGRPGVSPTNIVATNGLIHDQVVAVLSGRVG